MSWFDVAILVFLGIWIFRGYRRGLLSQLLGLAGVVIALVAAFSYFSQVGGALDALLPIGPDLAGIIAFILIVVVINGLFAYAGRKWQKAEKSAALSLTDAVGGAILGGLKALFILVIVTVVLVSLPIPALRSKVEEGPVTAQILRVAPVLYIIQERSLPPDVPRLLITAQGVQLRRINFADLDGAVCLACGKKVKYEGFVRRGLLSYPRFTCQGCGQASDGCLTYQGYHLIYHRCPLDLANRGENLNCTVWPSAQPVTPSGPCPVCGQR